MFVGGVYGGIPVNWNEMIASYGTYKAKKLMF